MNIIEGVWRNRKRGSWAKGIREVGGKQQLDPTLLPLKSVKAVLLETSLGNIAIDLYVDEAPKECENFLKLCKVKYYNFSPFHRVVKDFIAQTGDPLGSGKGGKSIWGLVRGDAERFFPKPSANRIKHRQRGVVAMANNGADMHGSQFFITLAENLDSLDGKHSVFGEVVEEESFEVLDKINAAYTDEEMKPYQDIRGLSRHIPEKSPEPTAEQLKTVRIADDADMKEYDGMSEAEVEAAEKRKIAKAQSTILEMVGDIADADVAPDENVLFICKLNAVTTDEDLEIIFSRFGRIVSCEVIKDAKSGDSLQYAFVEFENKESAEEAYFKMDNALIDDRRIHVDFSQTGTGTGTEIETVLGIDGQGVIRIEIETETAAGAAVATGTETGTGTGTETGVEANVTVAETVIGETGTGTVIDEMEIAVAVAEARNGRGLGREALHTTDDS
eukprot:gene10329-3457_t